MTTALDAVKLALVMAPVTAKLVKVPTDVILGCEAVCNVPVNCVALILRAEKSPLESLSTKEDAVLAVSYVSDAKFFDPSVTTALDAVKLALLMAPVTAKLVKVPTDVMLGCEAVCKVPVNCVAVMLRAEKSPLESLSTRVEPVLVLV